MESIREDHSREQYFFDRPTAEALADRLMGFERVCCLGAPTVAQALLRRGRSPELLDIDPRLGTISGFHRFDILAPEPTGTIYDAIFCDPPFFGLPLRALKRTISRLAGYRFDLPLLLAWLARRPGPLLRSFEPFGLRSTELSLGYETVAPTTKNAIILYSNIDSSIDSEAGGSW